MIRYDWKLFCINMALLSFNSFQSRKLNSFIHKNGVHPLSSSREFIFVKKENVKKLHKRTRDEDFLIEFCTSTNLQYFH